MGIVMLPLLLAGVVTLPITFALFTVKKIADLFRFDTF